MEGQRSDASFVETVKLEISSAIREIAENAIRIGLHFDVIAQISGLTVEKIQEIADAMKCK